MKHKNKCKHLKNYLKKKLKHHRKLKKYRRNPTIFEALIPIVSLIAFLMIGIFVYDASPHIPLIMGSIIAGLMGMRLGHSWASIKEGIVRSIKSSTYAILILMIIGTVIGTWMLSGVVPIMIYYGLQILNPNIFLIATVVICCIVSLATGSSWTTAGTVGIALIGIGKGLGIPLPIVAGAIVSGAFFGDKMSPLSDTTNLAPAMSGARLFPHIKHMIYTTGPSLIISLILYTILGFKYSGDAVDTSSIQTILEAISTNFNLHPILFLVPIMIILMVILKIPAIPGLLLGSVLGGFFAFILQGANFGEIINAAHYGFVSDTGVKVVDNLLTRGGLDSMLWTVGLVLCALTLAGILEKTKVLSVIANGVLSFAKTTGSLIFVTLSSCIFTNIITGDQYLSIVIPGKMYKKVYEMRRLHPKNLSRALEDSGTLVSPLIPWSSSGAYMWSTLAVSPAAYFPYAFLCILNPIISAIYGFTGFSIVKLERKDTDVEEEQPIQKSKSKIKTKTKKSSKEEEKAKPKVGKKLSESIREIDMPYKGAK